MHPRNFIYPTPCYFKERKKNEKENKYLVCLFLICPNLEKNYDTIYSFLFFTFNFYFQIIFAVAFIIIVIFNTFVAALFVLLSGVYTQFNLFILT